MYCEYCGKDYELLEVELKKTKGALAEVSKDPGNEAWWSVIKYAYADGGDGARNINSITGHYLAMRRERDESRQQLPQSEKVIAGMRENAAAIAVRLGVDCEGMDDAATWHASVEAIEKSEKVAEKLAEAIGPLFSMAMDSFPKRPHEGACGPESSCDASCMDAAHCSDILRQSKKALALYAAHKKDTQPGGGNDIR